MSVTPEQGQPASQAPNPPITSPYRKNIRARGMPADDHVLQWNSSLNEWESVAPTFAQQSALDAFSGRFRSARATTGSVAGGGTVDVTVTFATAFADTAYTVQASVEQADAGDTLRVMKVVSRAAGSCVVRVVNTNATTAFTGTVHATAFHD